MIRLDDYILVMPEEPQQTNIIRSETDKSSLQNSSLVQERATNRTIEFLVRSDHGWIAGTSTSKIKNLNERLIHRNAKTRLLTR